MAEGMAAENKPDGVSGTDRPVRSTGNSLA